MKVKTVESCPVNIYIRKGGEQIVTNVPARDTSCRRGVSPCFWGGSKS